VPTPATAVDIVSKAFDGTKLFGGTDTTYDPASTTAGLDVLTTTKASTTIDRRRRLALANVNATVRRSVPARTVWNRPSTT